MENGREESGPKEDGVKVHSACLKELQDRRQEQEVIGKGDIIQEELKVIDQHIEGRGEERVTGEEVEKTISGGEWRDYEIF